MPLTFDDVLGDCGVSATSLATREAAALDGDGFVVLPAVVDAKWLAAIRTAFDARCDGTAPPDGDLACADPAFDGVYTHAKVLAAVSHVLGRAFQVLRLGARNPQPGYGLQGLHTDWLPRTGPGPYSVVTTIWPLDDFTAENGATRVVPATHLVPRPLPKTQQAPNSNHPDETLVLAATGSVLVFNGHLWHSGTRNNTGAPRRSLQCQFVATDSRPPGNARTGVPERLSLAARVLVGA